MVSRYMANSDLFREWKEYGDIDYEVARRIFEERWPKQHITI